MEPGYRRIAIGVAIVVACLGLVLAGLWATRRPLTEAAVRAYLADNDVEAHYRVAQADSRRLVFDAVVLGPAARPDLVASRISVDLAWSGFGPKVTAVRLDAPVLRAAASRGGVSFGSLDRLIPTTKTLRLPPIAIAITDGRALVATPYGPLSASVDAAGRLDRDFHSNIRIDPAVLGSAACRAGIESMAMMVTTKARDFAISGTGELGAIDCAAAKVARTALSFQLAAPITLASFTGDVSARSASGQVGQARFGAPSVLRLDGTGTTARFTGKWSADVARLAAAGESAATVAASGNFDLQRVRGLTLDGSLRATSVQSRTLRAGLTVRGAPGVVESLVARTASAFRSFDVDGDFSAVLGAVPTARVTSLALRGAGGARLGFVGTIGGSLDASQFDVDGNFNLAGGGLPTTRLGLSRLTSKGGLRGSGTLVVAPWRSASGMIAVPGLTFALAAGRADVSGRAIVSTNIGAGRVDGLDLRLALRSDLAGSRVSLASGCADIAMQGARFGTLALGRFATRVCPVAGAAAPVLAGQLLSGDVRLAATRVQGVAGGRAFAVDLQPARFGFGGTLDRPVVRSAAVAVQGRSGELGGAATLAGMVTGGAGGWSGSGRIANAAADLPDVRARRGAAQWRLARGKLMLAAATVQMTDRAARPSFAPLRITDASASLGAERIIGRATLRLDAGLASLATITGNYRPGPGTGSAQVYSTLVFSKALQPLQISELARGLVANVDGKLVSHADLTFGPGGVKGTGSMTFAALSLATAALGPVTGINGTLHFDDLPRLHTPPTQTLTIESINPGVLVTDGVAVFQIEDATTVAIESMRWPFTGGTLTLRPVIFRTGEPRRSFVLAVDGLEADQFLQRFELKNLNATGRFDGILPLVFIGSVGRIEGGLLTARSAGGTIQYVGDVGQESMGAAARLAFDALRRLRYRSLSLALDGDLDGELVTAINFTGTNEAPVQVAGGLPLQSSGLPFKFGVTVRAPFRALLGTVASFSDARALLRSASPESPEPEADGHKPEAETPQPEARK